MDNLFKSPLTTISIGPGIRGIERGIGRVTELREIAFVEIEAFIIENLVAQMEQGVLDPAVIWSDCKTFNAELFRGKVNLLLAGYPCQPFSNAGQRKGAEDPRHLWPHIERTIDIIRPDMCVFENVRGHVTLGLREVIGSLERLGYRVHWGIFSAEETGATHKRERVFIMAIRKCWLDNTNGIRHKSEHQISARRHSTESAGEKLADTNDDGERTRQGEIRSKSKTTEGTEQWKERNEAQRKRSRAESCNHGELAYPDEFGINESINEDGKAKENYLGDTNNSGLQGRVSGIGEECSREWITGANGPFAPVSRPGQPQQAWEHPRVISREVESSMGMSIDGYNFREDFLRALGNSVVEQTAELAFRTLIQKFL